MLAYHPNPSNQLRSSAWPLALLLAACTPSSPTGDDEAGVTTGMETSEDDSSTGTSETETETESTSSDTDSEEDTSMTKPDVLPIECDPYLQDCPDGFKCSPYSNNGASNWNAHKCVPVLGDQAPGEPCTYDGVEAGTDDCDATSMCFEDVCTPFCTGSVDTPMCPAGSVCSISGDGVLTICLDTCDPIAQDCPDGQGCFYTGNEFLCVTALERVGVGDECGFINDCAVGLACLPSEYVPDCAGAGCCAPFCSLMDPDCASLAGTECTAFFEQGQAPEGYEDVGVCVIPK